MRKNLQRILALVLVMCCVLSLTLPAANAASAEVKYNFYLLSDYNKLPNDPSGKSNPFTYAIMGGDYLANCTNKKSIPERYASGNLNWTYEASSAGNCGTTTQLEHLPLTSGNRYASSTLRTTMGLDNWMAFRIQSPGAGVHTVKLNYRCFTGAPTVAVYILEAEGEASIDHDTVLARRDAIHAAIDPDNRVGKVDQNAGVNNRDYSAFLGNYTFEANKEYIVVFENYEKAAIAGNYASLTSLTCTPGATQGTETKGEPEINSVLVQSNVVPASDGGHMAAVAEVNGHDYYFLPLEGGRMAIFDLDKHIAGEPSQVATVTTGLYYPTHATVTNDGRVIVGGDGKKLYIFDTKTMTGRNTPDFRAAAGLEGEGHNQGAHYGADGYLYFGTCYGGHTVQYDIPARTYTDLGDVITPSVWKMAGITQNTDEETGKVTATYYHNGYLYAKASSDHHTVIVKVDVAKKKPVAAIDVTEQLQGCGVPHGVTVLGDKYVIAGGTNASGMVLIDLATFKLVAYDEVVSRGLFSSMTSTTKSVWENGMGGHASEVINGKQYFYVNSVGLYSYNLETGKMVRESTNFKYLRTGQKTTVTLDMNKDGTEETYLITFSGSGVRLFDVDRKSSKLITDLTLDTSAVGGSSINIGDYHDGVLYIGAWNNWNCAAFDTKTETIVSRYVTGGQTDSQVSYLDENGNFHLVSGNYSACVVYEIDPLNKTGYGGDAETNIIQPLIANMKKYDQKRIHTVEGGDGYVFAGTIPDSYTNGGGVGVYNRETGTEDFIHFKETPTAGEKCVPAEFKELWDLSVKGIVYSDGLLYGATSRSGGSGSTAVEGTSAQIFVMDYEKMEILATLDLRDHLTLVDADKDGKEDPIAYVGGISVDPSVPGRIWGVVSDVLFCFTYDKTNKTFKVQEVLNLGHSEYQSSGGVGQHNRKVHFDLEKNQLFVSFYKSEMQQITIRDWKAAVGNIRVTKNEMILNDSPETYALGADNNLYYASGTSLYVKPLNVTAADWTDAKAVDAQIVALGKITLEKADDVAAARAAYDNLKLRDKALVQEKRTLEEAEAQIFRLQVDAASTAVTAEAYEELDRLSRAYMNMTDKQKRYIKNAERLENAFAAAAMFKQNEALNQLQKDIFALEVDSLEDTQVVAALRQRFNAFPEELRSVLDAQKLFAGEELLIHLWEESGKDIASGTCGENLRWALSGRGMLTVSGLGSISEMPWSGHSAFIKKVILEGGIYEIADDAFDQCNSLTTVYYGGTQEQMERIDLGENNQALTDACWHYEAVSFMLGAQVVHQCGCCDSYHYENNGVDVFADISNSGWQVSHAIYACQKGLMAGKGTDTYGRVKFDPNSPITREEFVQVLYNAEGKPAFENDRVFPDVADKGWYKNAVLWANFKNIANGLGDGSFGIGKNITRQDLALMLFKYATLKGLDLTTEEGKIDVFADGDKVSGYAKNAMNWAVKNGILSGKGTAGKPLSTFKLDPAGTATRAECAAMLKNFMNAFSLGESLPVCAHRNLQASAGKERTCTEDGDLAYWYCADCNRYYSDQQCSTLLAPALIHLKAAGHNWQDATCTAPKTCSECQLTEGAELGHRWNDATCTEPKTCTVCNLTEGTENGHSWQDATCTAPKTCDNCGETQGEPLPHSPSFQKTVPPTCSAEGYDLYKCDHCDYTEKKNVVPVTEDHSYVTIDLETAATMATLAGDFNYARFASDDYCDYDVSICTDCLNIDLGTAHFRYTQREAAEIMLGYVNDLRAEVFGTHAYDLVLDDFCQRSAEFRAVQLITDYSHSGQITPGECITSHLSLYDQFVSLKNSPRHYEIMIRKDNQYFGYGYASNESEEWTATQGFGCMTFG